MGQATSSVRIDLLFGVYFYAFPIAATTFGTGFPRGTDHGERLRSAEPPTKFAGNLLAGSVQANVTGSPRRTIGWPSTPKMFLMVPLSQAKPLRRALQPGFPYERRRGVAAWLLRSFISGDDRVGGRELRERLRGHRPLGCPKCREPDKVLAKVLAWTQQLLL